MAAITEEAHDGEFVVSEANGTRSREEVTMVSGTAAMTAGAVVGKVTASGKYAAYDDGLADGTEVCAGVLFGAVDASAADAQCTIIARDAELNSSEIDWLDQAGAEIVNGTADLLALGIILR